MAKCIVCEVEVNEFQIKTCEKEGLYGVYCKECFAELMNRATREEITPEKAQKDLDSVQKALIGGVEGLKESLLEVAKVIHILDYHWKFLQFIEVRGIDPRLPVHQVLELESFRQKGIAPDVACCLMFGEMI